MLILLNVVWLMLVVFGLPGNWLIVISTCLFAWWRWEDGVFSIYTLTAIVVLAILGELFEFLGGVQGAKRAGASWRSSIAAVAGAVAGAIIGTFLIPVVFLGTVLGACLGAGFATWSLELSRSRKMGESVRCAVSAGLGELLGITAKITVGVIIWLMVAVAAFWP
ncbi:MAG: DUF456 domain-containing protein [Sedimentisphaerales bacterium]|nr:DUF456 domain-containing protein [Sedimentisphaerales bacterium]